MKTLAGWTWILIALIISLIFPDEEIAFNSAFIIGNIYIASSN